MKPSVQNAFKAFTETFEGALNFMYLDVLGLVTTGYGNKVDSWSEVSCLQWVHLRTGVEATRAEVVQAWNAVKSATALERAGGGHFAALTDLRLTPDALTRLFNDRMLSNETFYVRRWANWDAWPADAQLGAHSCGWAAGAMWVAPKFDAAVAALDFDTAAKECWLTDTNNPGLHPRNLANVHLFENAAAVLSLPIFDPETLYYPGTPSI
jgi:GH24 family phage-related lysozyme (muramidase)